MYIDKMKAIITSGWKWNTEFEHFDLADLVNDKRSHAEAWVKSTQAASHVFTFGLLSDAYKFLPMQWISRS